MVLNDCHTNKIPSTKHPNNIVHNKYNNKRPKRLDRTGAFSNNINYDCGRLRPLHLYTRNRFLPVAGPAYGYESPPSLFSSVSEYLPWCTHAANLMGAKTSLVPPKTHKHLKIISYASYSSQVTKIS